MSSRTDIAYAVPRRARVAHLFRILHVVAAAEFKLKYAGSTLGYVWSIVKPLTLFTMFFALSRGIPRLLVFLRSPLGFFPFVRHDWSFASKGVSSRIRSSRRLP